MPELERQRKILEIVEKKGSISVNKLIKLIGVSPATVRRSLNMMTDKKLIVRTHGYVHSLDNINLTVRPIDERLELSYPEKRAIAQAALKFIEPGMNIILDSGTTTLELSRLLLNHKLTIMTNSLDICAVLSQTQNTVMCTGGIQDGRTRCFLGPDAVKFISRFEVDAAFMGTTGVRSRVGLTTSSPLQADFKQACVSSAKHVYAIFDTSKFESSSLYTFAEFKDLDLMIISKPEDFSTASTFFEEFDEFGYPYVTVEARSK
ncbi:MAG: DeoR/GlpR transcriptional regulator [Clostridiaceae bacterium]|nr:DeoR/GlpR transcriptional regulator [Clostridiaceae bacterium]